LWLLGLLVLAVVLHKVDWVQFRQVLAGLRWPIVAAGFVLGVAAVAARSLRLTLVLDAGGRYGRVFRAVSFGYVGMLALPLGGGELLKVASLRSLLELPAATAATGWALDRMLDVAGLGLMVAMLVGLGGVIPLRHFQPWLLAVAPPVVALAGIAAVLALRSVLRRPPVSGPLRAGTRWHRRLTDVAALLATLRRPSKLLALVAVQLLVTALDVFGAWVGFHVFRIGDRLPLLTAVRLMTFLQASAALPLLPGGVGTQQAACVLALAPEGIPAAVAFAYSLVGQASSFLMLGTLGGLSAAWPASAPAREADPAD
jgi:hypothetical protein